MFAHVFAQIFDSSIADDPPLRHFFTDLLILANPSTGVVDMTPEAIAARTRLKLADVRRWITALEGPDPRSRTPDLDGARIVRLEPEGRAWGWRIVNWEKYQGTARKASVRLAETERKTAYRKREWFGRVKTPPRAPKPAKQPAPPPEVALVKSYPKGFPSSVEDAIARAEMCNVSAEIAEAAFHDANSRGGYDRHGNPVLNFASYAAKFSNYQRSREKERQPTNGAKAPQQPGLFAGQRLKLLEERKAELARKIQPLPTGEERSRLVAEHRQVTAQLDALKKELL